jgi:hypothetical protein
MVPLQGFRGFLFIPYICYTKPHDMKNSIYAALSFALLTSGINATAQAFRQGSLLISITEGSTHSQFSTLDHSTPGHTDVKSDYINGDRDPIIVEYGLSSRWGIGLNMGGDVFHVSPSTYYAVHTNDNKLITSEFSVEGNYHFFVSQQWDIAACGSLGLASVYFKGTDGDGAIRTYNAGGGIVRASVKSRFYFWRRLGAVGILSAYTSSCRPDPDHGSNVAVQTTTHISGWAFETGLCYRILR